METLPPKDKPKQVERIDDKDFQEAMYKIESNGFSVEASAIQSYVYNLLEANLKDK